jgi:hypothetical protein
VTADQRFTLILTLITVFFLPTLAFVIRATVKWTRVETRLDEIARDLTQLVADKDKTHSEMIQQMREDRNATNLRLRWLEEQKWNQRG